MNTFKLYFKIISRGLIWTFLMYFGIFSLFAVVFNNSGDREKSTEFSLYKCDTAVINYDDSQFSDSFEEYIKERSSVNEDIKTEEEIKDALFFRQINMSVIIPENFSEDFLNGKNPELKIESIPDSPSTHLMSMMLNSYLNTYKLYYDGNSGFSEDEIISHVKADLSKESEMSMLNESQKESLSGVNFFFNFAAYVFLAILILCISSIMAIFNELNLRRRCLCSPTKEIRFSMEYFVGNLVISLAVWLIFCVYSFIIYPEQMLSQGGLLYALNSLVFVIIALSIGFLLGNICDSKIISPISTVISLGCAFLGGSFVPQEILGENVLKIARIIPSYWFVRANNTIAETGVFTSGALKEIFGYMGIQLCFAAAFLAAALVIIKRKRTASV